MMASTERWNAILSIPDSRTTALSNAPSVIAAIPTVNRRVRGSVAGRNKSGTSTPSASTPTTSGIPASGPLVCMMGRRCRSDSCRNDVKSNCVLSRARELPCPTPCLRRRPRQVDACDVRPRHVLGAFAALEEDKHAGIPSAEIAGRLELQHFAAPEGHAGRLSAAV